MLNIYSSETSVKQTLVSFVNTLISRNPTFCDKFYSYMHQDYLPNNPTASNPMIAKYKRSFPNNGTYTSQVGDAVKQLSNGWWIYHNFSASGVITILQRIQEVFQSTGIPIKVYAYFESPSKPGILNYTEDDITKLPH